VWVGRIFGGGCVFVVVSVCGCVCVWVFLCVGICGCVCGCGGVCVGVCLGVCECEGVCGIVCVVGGFGCVSLCFWVWV
jgi:hypothetical protein